MAKFCSNCGKELKEGADVCLNCGKKVGASTSAPKDFDKRLVIAIVVGIVGIAMIMLFWLFVVVVGEYEEEPFVSHSTKKSCCVKAGGKWSSDRCVSGYWFDDDYYDNCIENSF